MAVGVQRGIAVCSASSAHPPAGPPPAADPHLPAALRLQVRTLPKVLKFLPSDKAQDARNFVQGEWVAAAGRGARAGGGGGDGVGSCCGTTAACGGLSSALQRLDSTSGRGI